MFIPKYPKGHTNKLILGNSQNHIGICTLWTPPRKIVENLDPNLFSIAGQLVTKTQGISAIIRNCLMHGGITDIIIYGVNLTGTKEALHNLIEKGVDENYNVIGVENAFIEKEIPFEAIELFRKNINLHYADRIDNELLKSISKKNKYMEFPESEIESPKMFPSEEIVYVVRSKTISEAWPQILTNIRKFGELKPSRHGEMQEIHQMIVEISQEDTNNFVLNDDFPFTLKELEDYYPQVCTKNPVSNVEYTYGQRIFDYKNINQINYVIETLKNDKDSRYAYVTLWDPVIDTSLGKDQPCLTALNFLVKDNKKLNLSAWIRSNDMWAAWPSNTFALRKLQENVAKELDLEVGNLVTNSMSAHIYSQCFEEADKIIQKRKINYIEKDKRGDLIIFVSDNEINVIHKDLLGNELGNYKGLTAMEVMNKLIKENIFGSISHAGDIGMELQKAEIALKKNIEYIQDKELNF
ncbi:thymidylate synthase [Nanoarchaeota archaeon]